MSLTCRILPVEEWGRLAHSYLGTQLAQLDRQATVLVVESERGIIGTWAMLLRPEVHGFWMDDASGHSADCARLLLAKMAELVTATGCEMAYTTAETERLGGYLKRNLWAKETTVYAVPFLLLGDRQRGRAFHRELRKVTAEPPHAANDEHDIAVGATLRLAFEAHEPETAVARYNAWAGSSGYEPISGWARHEDGSATVDFGSTLTLTFDREGHICQSAPR